MAGAETCLVDPERFQRKRVPVSRFENATTRGRSVFSESGYRFRGSKTRPANLVEQRVDRGLVEIRRRAAGIGEHGVDIVLARFRTADGGTVEQVLLGPGLSAFSASDSYPSASRTPITSAKRETRLST